MDYVYHYQSPLGGITLTSDGAALVGLWFDKQRFFADSVVQDHEEKSLPVFEQADRWLDLYFTGVQPDFTPPCRIPGLTPFRKEVISAMEAIPFGSITTYSQIARTIAERRQLPKMSARAVGGAVGWNPICIIIPCHRVVGAGGSLTGYGGGISNKIALLRLEGHDMSRFTIPSAGTVL